MLQSNIVKMKSKFYFLTIASFVFTLTACTHNYSNEIDHAVKCLDESTKNSVRDCVDRIDLWRGVIMDDYWFVNPTIGTGASFVEGYKDTIFNYISVGHDFNKALAIFDASPLHEVVIVEAQLYLDSCAMDIAKMTSPKKQQVEIYNKLLSAYNTAEALLDCATKVDGSLKTYSAKVNDLKEKYEAEIREINNLIKFSSK